MNAVRIPIEGTIKKLIVVVDSEKHLLFRWMVNTDTMVLLVEE